MITLSVLHLVPVCIPWPWVFIPLGCRLASQDGEFKGAGYQPLSRKPLNAMCAFGKGNDAFCNVKTIWLN